MKDVAPHDRPREKLERLGPAGLGDNELLALVLGSGLRGRGALELANRLISHAGGLQGFTRMGVSALRQVAGIGRARAAQVIAAVEFGRRTLVRDMVERPRLTSPREMAAYLLPEYGSCAVEQRDYRLALNHALESREQAQNAARTAADTRATLRGDVERSRAEIAALVAQVRAWIDGPASARTPRTRRAAQQVVTQAAGDLQKAGAAMQAEDYTGAQRILAAVKERIQKGVPAVAGTPAAQSPRRRR